MVEEVLPAELRDPRLRVDDLRQHQPLDVVRIEVVALVVVRVDEHAGHQRVVGDVAVALVERGERLLDPARAPDRLDDAGHPAAEMGVRSRATPSPRSRRRGRRRRRRPRGSRRRGRRAGVRSRLASRCPGDGPPAGRRVAGRRIVSYPRDSGPAVGQVLAQLLERDRVPPGTGRTSAAPPPPSSARTRRGTPSCPSGNGPRTTWRRASCRSASST